MSVQKVVERILPVVSNPNNISQIRNISVIAHVDHGKTTLTDALCVRAGCIGRADGRRFMDIRPDEQERTITIKSSSISLPFLAPVHPRRPPKSPSPPPRGETSAVSPGEEAKKSEKKKKKRKNTPSPPKSRHDPSAELKWGDPDAKAETQRVLVNLIDSPGHVDFSSEVSAALRLTDGAMVVIDCAKGVCVQTRTVVRQALAERVKPVLFLNKVDKMFTKWPDDPEACYQALNKAIESLNAIITVHDPQIMGSVTVHPENGSVGFGSGLQGWGFTLRRFAAIYHDRLGISERKMMKKLWGDNFYDPKTRTWRRNRSGPGAKRLQRGFCRFVLRPLYQLYNACAQNDSEALQKWQRRLGFKFTWELTGLGLFGKIMKRWMPAASPMVNMIHKHLPSPDTAQKYRVPVLYTGPADDAAARAIATADAKGPLMMYISKMIPSGDGSRFYGFGRIFSGTIAPGQTVRLMGADYVPGAKADLNVKPVQSVSLMMGPYTSSVARAGPGCIVGLKGVDKYLLKNGTVSTDPNAHGFIAMKYAVSPVVRTAVRAKSSGQQGRLAIALRQLAQSDPLVQVYRNKDTGEHVVACCGELHLDICLKDLREFMGSAGGIHNSEPVVTFRETVAKEGEDPSLAKSPNKLNRVQASAKPLDEGLEAAVCSPESKSALSDPMVCNDMKRRARALVSEFGWAPATAKKVWHLDCDDGRANLLVDCTKGCQLTDVKDMVIGAFKQATERGVWTGEPVSGMCVDLLDFKLHSDSAHRNARQIAPMTKAVVHATQLMSTSRILEPVFEIVVTTPKHAEGGAFKTLRKRGATILDQKGQHGGDSLITATLPVRRASGFNGDLKGDTSGSAFAQMSFSHWAPVPGDIRDPSSEAHKVVMEIRKRKGMPDKLPDISDYHMKL